MTITAAAAAVAAGAAAAISPFYPFFLQLLYCIVLYYFGGCWTYSLGGKCVCVYSVTHIAPSTVWPHLYQLHLQLSAEACCVCCVRFEVERTVCPLLGIMYCKTRKLCRVPLSFRFLCLCRRTGVSFRWQQLFYGHLIERIEEEEEMVKSWLVFCSLMNVPRWCSSFYTKLMCLNIWNKSR